MKKYGISSVGRFTRDSSQGMTGLSNLGNTCFMNSSLQCLSSIPELTSYLISHKYIQDLNNNNPLGSGGYLVSAYAELLKKLWQGNNSSISPWRFKKVIGKIASQVSVIFILFVFLLDFMYFFQFSGYNQHDSQELLSYLLDGLHEDLNKVIEKPLIASVESNGKEVNKIAKQSWHNYLKRNESKIVDLFVGQVSKYQFL